MSFSGKKLFTRFMVEHGSTKKGKPRYVCSLCYPNWDADCVDNVATLTRNSGYTWCTQYLSEKYPGYESLVLQGVSEKVESSLVKE